MFDLGDFAVAISTQKLKKSKGFATRRFLLNKIAAGGKPVCTGRGMGITQTWYFFAGLGDAEDQEQLHLLHLRPVANRDRGRMRRRQFHREIPP